MTKPTGRPVGRPRKFDEDASVLKESKAQRASAMSEIASALAQLGASNRGEIDIHEIDPQRLEWYVDTIDAGGFTVPGLRQLVGPGRYMLDIFEVGQDGRRKKIRRVPCNLRPVPGSAPTTATAATPATDNSAAAQAVAMMSSGMQGMAKAFESIAAHRGPDVLDVVKALTPLMAPRNGGGGAGEALEMVKIFREGMTVGRENSGNGGPLERAIDAATPLIDRIGKRIEQDGEHRRALGAGAGAGSGQASRANAQDMTLEQVLEEICPFIQKRLARGVPGGELAGRVLEDIFDLVGPKRWQQLLDLSGSDDFNPLMLKHLEPSVGAEHRAQLELLIAAAREQLQQLAAKDAAAAAAAE